jgi:hypothetical protein
MLVFPLSAATFVEVAFHMQKLNVTLWMNQAEDWSVEINGLLYEHIPSEILEDLVECALIAAQRSLCEAATRRPV